MNPQNTDDMIRGMTSKQEGEQVEGLQQSLQSYSLGYAPPPPEPPQTFVIECNKVEAQADGDLLRANTWTNSFPPIKLKKGDVVSVNSAFLSSRGSGDLLQFDPTNNKTRFMFEYYATNDNANHKYPQYNVLGAPTGIDSWIWHGTKKKPSLPTCSMNCMPANYRPMKLYRLMKTFQDSFLDYGLTPNQYSRSTGPNQNMPFYSPQLEPFWGYDLAKKFLIEGVEDDYIPGLIRQPQINVREFSVSGIEVGDPTNPVPSPAQYPFFGFNLQDLRIWYISTPYSAYGACSDNATMRIYFAYGNQQATIGAEPYNKASLATMELLKRLRIGDNLQLRNTGSIFGERAEAYIHKNTTSGAFNRIGGSNVFVCRGYKSWGNSYTTPNGDLVDNFEQYGSWNNDKYKRNDIFSALGEIMRVVKINMGTYNTASKGGHMPDYNPNNIDTFSNYLPFIEVQAPRGVSIAFGNPNVANTRADNGYTAENPTVEGLPWIGPYVAGQSGPKSDANMYLSPRLSLTIRSWTAENRTPQISYPTIPANIDKPTAYPWQTKTKCSNPFPDEDITDPDDPTLKEKLYVAFRPYYYSVDDPNGDSRVEDKNNMDSSYFMNLEEEKITTATDLPKYNSMIGLTGPQTLTAHNYNIDTLGRNGKSATTADPSYLKYGHDLIEDNKRNYSGGRIPNNFQLPNDLALYTNNNYSTVSRVGIHNQGQDYFPRVANNYLENTGGGYLYPYDAVNNPVGRNNDTSWSSISTMNRGQQNIAPDSGIYTRNQKGNPVKFFFTGNIDNHTLHYTGADIQIWDKTAGGRDADHLTGMRNYIVGGANMPNAIYRANPIAVPPADHPNVNPNRWSQVVNDLGGLWYGYDFKLAPYDSPDINAPHLKPFSYRTGENNGSGCAGDIADWRIAMGQFPSETYARFTNYDVSTNTTTSEVMYIKVLFQTIDNVHFTDQKDLTKLNANSQTMETRETAITTIHAIDPVAHPDGAPARSVNGYAPMFIILRRDCMNTGLISFSGNDTKEGAQPHLYDPVHFAQQPRDSKTQPALNKVMTSFFEILNGWSQIEHQIKIDNHIKDVLNIGYDNQVDTPMYQYNFGDITTRGRYGNQCGGDYYLTKFPNMPYKEAGTNRLRVCDSMIRLSEGLIKTGQPTRSNVVVRDFDKMSSMGGLAWDVHYDYIDLTLEGDKNYYSPSDIGTFITEQLHKPKDLYKSWDNVLKKGGGNRPDGTMPYSAGKYPMNALFRPIHGPSASSDDPTNKDVNSWDNNNTGSYGGLYHEGDFTFKIDIQQENLNNGIEAYGSVGGMLWGGGGDDPANGLEAVYQVPKSGEYEVLIPNAYTYLRTAPTTNHYSLGGFGLGEGLGGNIVKSYYKTGSFSYRDNQYSNTEKYNKTECFGSMFIGSNNAQLIYNTDVSRFEWKFFHQPKYSEYTSDGGGGATTATIWSEAIEGTDNWDRYGGINMINWCAPVVGFDQVRTKRDEGYANPITTKEAVGLGFMNKLGFSENWLDQYSGSDNYPDVADKTHKVAYRPLGTTASDYDISQATNYTRQNSLMYIGSGIDPSTGGPRNYGPMEIDNTAGNGDRVDISAWSYNTSDVDIQGGTKGSMNGSAPYGSSKGDTTGGTGKDVQKLVSVGGDIAYGAQSTLATPHSVEYAKPEASQTPKIQSEYGGIPTNLNIDDVKYFNYQVQVDSNTLRADELPKKTTIGYFLIMSDIIDKHEFIGSANNGSPLKCIGILSKNYANTDFYFSFQSPVEFHIKQDRTITSIKTEIMTPSLNDPIGLDYNSSIIYSIVRPETVPEPDVPPIAIQQALDYGVMEQLSGQLGIANSMYGGTTANVAMGIGNSGGASLNQLRQNLVSAVLSPTTTSAVSLYRTQTEISGTLSRMSVGERMRMLRQGVAEDPTKLGGALTQPDISQAQEEGLGITQPVSQPTEPYLSAEQLQIQELNIAGKKPARGNSADSGMASSVGDPFNHIPPTPFNDITGDDEDAKSLASHMTKEADDAKDDMYELLSPSEIGKTPQQLFSMSAHNSRRQSGTGLQSHDLPTFFAKYMSVASDEVRQFYRNEQSNYGFRVDNPAGWRLGVLRNWTQGGQFDWGEGMYKKIGATMNLEARSKITQAQGQYEGMGRSEQRARRKGIIAQQEEMNLPKEDIASVEGSEKLNTRMSRGDRNNPTTSMGEKMLHSDTFKSPVQNRYDLRTWSMGNLNKHITDLNVGVPHNLKNEQTRLSTSGQNKINNEIQRRRDGKRALQMTADNHYKNKGQAPEGYDPMRPHKTPHSSVGKANKFAPTLDMGDVMARGKERAIASKSNLKKDGKASSGKKVKFKVLKESDWKEGFIKGHAFPELGVKGNRYMSHTEALKEAKKDGGQRVKGITRIKYGENALKFKGQSHYELRGGSGKIVPNPVNYKHQQHSQQYHHTQPAPSGGATK